MSEKANSAKDAAAAAEPARKLDILDVYLEELRSGDEPALAQARAGCDDAELAKDLEVAGKLYQLGRLVDEDSADLQDPLTTIDWEIGREPSLPLPAGTMLGEYRIEELLGQGGMGEVYRARHCRLDCLRAVKVIAPRREGMTAVVERFLREGRALASLQHANVVAATDAGCHEGGPYLAMEYVVGINLRERVEKGGPLAPAQACDYIRQAALGLEYAHQHGIIHRDIKPANLLLTPDGTVKILDMGLARLLWESSEGNLTTAGAAMGTPNYMAPEQRQNAARADARSDVYGLGRTFEYLLAGAVAEQKDSAALQEARPTVPAAVRAVVEKATAPRPEDRYASVRGFIEALDGAVDGPHSKHPKRRQAAALQRRWPAAVAAAVLLLGAAAVVVLLRPDSRPETPPRLDLLAVEFYAGIPHAPVKTGTQILVDHGQDQKADLAPWRFNADEGLRLRGHFSRPVRWYLVWIDSAGKVAIRHDVTETADLQYPPSRNDKPQVVRPSPKDPKGTHLLLFLAGPAGPLEGVRRLQSSFEGAAKPPAVAWGGQVRGPEEIPLAGPLPADYLRRMFERIPEGFVPVYWLFLATEK